MRSRRWLIALIAATALSACIAAAAPFAVRNAVVSKLAGRGLVAQVDGVALRPTRVWLTGVHITSEKLPSLDVRLDAIEVRFGLSGLRAVNVHGGSVRLTGTIDDVRSAFASPSTEGSEASGGGGYGLPIDAHGLFFDWQAGAEESYTMWGISARRDGGRFEVDADLLRAHREPFSAQVTGLRSAVDYPELTVVKFGASTTDVNLRLASAAPPLARAPPASGGTSATRSEPATTRPPKRQKGDAAPSKPRLPPVPFLTLDAERGLRIKRRLAAISDVLARRLPSGAEIGLDQVRIVVQRGRQSLNLGPARLRLSRSADRLEVDLAQGDAVAAEQPLDVRLSLPMGEGAVQMRASGGPVSLSRLGVREGDFGLANVQGAKLRLELNATLSASSDQASLQTSGELTDLSVNHPKLSPDVLSGMSLAWTGQGELKLDGSELNVEQGQIRFGAVSANASVKLERDSSRLVIDAKVEVPTASCQDMFDSLPRGAVGLLAGTRFSGTFSWNAALQLDTNRLSDVDAKWRMNNRCRLAGVSPDIDPQRFKQPFTRVVPGVAGDELLVYSGPGTADWYPLSQISRYMEVAVLTTEDGGFWRHRGFDQGAIEGAIRQNVQSGRYARGASTISMQLAKNLYLSRDKHLTRKIQEALLTMLLEQELSKAEILELYFNIVEFGPDIWGIGMAADHYFNAKPVELSIAQSFFLASLLPSPKVERFAENGSLNPKWATYLRHLMRIAHSRHRLSAAELDEGLAQEVQFGVPNLLSDVALEEGDRGAGEPDWEGELRGQP